MDEIDIKKSKEPWLAVNISSIFPEMGQIYSGKIASAKIHPRVQ